MLFKRYLYYNYKAFSAFKFLLRRRITVTGWIVLFSTLAAAALGVDTTASLAYQSFTFLFGLVLVSALLVLFSRAKNISAERILPRFASAGEPLYYSIIVRNTSRRAQRGLRVRDQFPDPRPNFLQFVNTPEPEEEKRNWFDRLYSYYRWNWLISMNTRARAEEQPLPDFPPRSQQNVRVELMPLRRGVLRFDSIAIVTFDPFGLFRALRKLPAPQSMLVLPKRYTVPPFELPGTMKYQQGGVSMASSIGESEEFVSLREYRPGDPLRRIHWKSFAKVGEPVVKEFQDEFFVRHALILDTFSPLAHSEIFEEAVSVAASLAYTIQNQDSLLDLMFIGPKAYCFTSGRGVAHTEQMLEVLASVQTCRDKNIESLQELVREHATEVSGCLCVFIEWDEARMEFVRNLKAQKIPLLVFVVTASDGQLNPGPMADEPENFHTLRVGKIGEKLAAL